MARESRAIATLFTLDFYKADFLLLLVVIAICFFRFSVLSTSIDGHQVRI